MIKKWKEFIKIENINESLNLSLDDFFNSISATRLDPRLELKLSQDFDLDIKNLEKSNYFFNSLKSLGLESGEVFDSMDFETFIRTPFKFFFIYQIPANAIIEPDFLIIQPDDSETQLWKLNVSVKNFLDKLSTRTITIESDGENWIYSSSNGNNWTLLNKKSKDKFKKELSREEIEKLTSDDSINFRIN